MNGWVILDSLHVAVTTIALAAGLRVLVGLIFGQLTNEFIPIYFAATIVVCLTTTQLPVEPSAASVMVMVICLLSALTAIHARYFGLMHGAYRTLYAAATSVSVISLGAGATLQGIAALPELKAILPLLSRKAALLILLLAVSATALAIRGASQGGRRESWLGSAH